MKQLKTPFIVDENNVLSEYPRPQSQRDSYLNLNGVWDFAVSSKKEDFPTTFSHTIIVPFSPQSILSKTDLKVKDFDYLYYQKKFVFPDNFNKGKILLHFGAVDMYCEVYFNGQKAAEHVGGFHPFSVDVTPYLADGIQTLQLIVWDLTDSSYHTTGKQSLRRGGIWYTAQSGIWQTVWCESVPTKYIKNFKVTPLYDESLVKIEVFPNGELKELTAKVLFNGKIIAQGSFEDYQIHLSIPDFIPWSPENPHLYDLEISTDTDKVKSYFGMRKFSIAPDKKGKMRICLNNKPYFMKGLLDQGYWSDGLLTAPTDQALIYDIQTMKDLGFNMLRKHIKIEPLRWYYHCDRLGMLVWQDAPSGGKSNNNLFKQILGLLNLSFDDKKYSKSGRKNKEGREEFVTEYVQMLDYLKNVVSICTWVPFNEGWGQFDSVQVAKLTKEIDNTRLVDHASGFYDQGGDDFKSIHVYFRPLYKIEDKRPFVLSEFGGYGLVIPEHSYNDKKVFQYSANKNKEQLMTSLTDLFEKQVYPLIENGLCATVYTQVSDVEDEINGLLTYDRKVCKVDKEQMVKINSRIKYDDNI